MLCDSVSILKNTFWINSLHAKMNSVNTLFHLQRDALRSLVPIVCGEQQFGQNSNNTLTDSIINNKSPDQN